MNNLTLKFSGVDLSRLRTLVAGVEKEVGLVARAAAPPQGLPPGTALEVAWSSLVQMLDLGAEPEMRECPACKDLCMLGATRCWRCWATLPAAKAKEKATAA
jgi:hypothetical protein